jgi:hypothetical protein
MNIENLTQEEIKNLHTLLGKMIDEPKQKVYFDPINKMVDEILDEFNFERVQTVMFKLNWQWAMTAQGIPTIEELKETAERLLRQAAEYRLGDYKDSYWELGIINATGGFQATAFCDETKTRITGLDLKFVLTEYDAGEE